MKDTFQNINGRCMDIVDHIMSSPDIPDNENLRFRIRLSVEEAVNNVINYAYGDADGWIEVEVGLSEDRNALVINLKDGGKPFNPLEQDSPQLDLPLDERRIGGLGVFFYKTIMDSVSYRYESGCNVLSLKKNLK